MPRANDSAAPAKIAGTRAGRITRRNVVSRPAPSEAAASSTSVSSSSSTGCTVRTTNGSVTNAIARNTAQRVLATLEPDRAVGAVEREQHQAGDDRRQRERDVDDEVEQAACPGTGRGPAPRRWPCPSPC